MARTGNLMRTACCGLKTRIRARGARNTPAVVDCSKYKITLPAAGERNASGVSPALAVNLKKPYH